MFEVAGSRVLITQSVFSSVGGSEVQAIELARYLRSCGCSVTLYSWLAEYPLAEMIEAEGFTLVTPNSNRAVVMSASDFDLVWVQHECLPVELLKSVLDSSELPLFIFLHLSPYQEVYQEFPFFGDLEERLADVIAFNAQSTLCAQAKFFDSVDRFALYENPAPLEFVDAPVYQGEVLEKLLIVSNHPPRELMEAAELLSASGTRVSYLSDVVDGVLPQVISPEILEGFDCAVSIGKTVQDCLVMGIPVYVYDRFAGPGYLNNFNFDQVSSYNFSGRSAEDGNSLLLAQERAVERRQSPSDIAHAILDGYKDALVFQRERRAEFINRYRIDVCFERLCKQAAERRSLHGRPDVSAAWAERMALSQRMMKDYFAAHRLVCLSEKYFYAQSLQLFEKRGHDAAFSERESRYLDVRLRHELELDIKTEGLAEIRLDTGEQACVLADVTVLGSDEQEVEVRIPSDLCIERIHFFFHGDPQIIVSGPGEEGLPSSVRISARVERLENISCDLVNRVGSATLKKPFFKSILHRFGCSKRN